MWSPDVTWGELRAFHNMLEAEGMTSPDDFLVDPVFASKGQNQSDDALVFPEDSGITYSFTVEANNDSVLELLKVDEDEGKMYYRAQSQWHDVVEDEEAPTIFEVPMFDIDEQSVQWAIDLWDNLDDEDESLTLEDVKEHLV